jgi:hypothetical protein
VPVEVAVQETGLRTKVKNVGDRWDPEKRFWMLKM